MTFFYTANIKKTAYALFRPKKHIELKSENLYLNHLDCSIEWLNNFAPSTILF